MISDMEALTAMLVIFGIIAIVALWIALMAWVFNSCMLYSFCKCCGHDTPWLAWLPFGSLQAMTFVQGCNIVRPFQVPANIVTAAGFCSLLIVGSVLSEVVQVACMAIGFLCAAVGALLQLAFIVFTVMSIVNVCEETQTSPAVPLLVYFLVPFCNVGVMCIILRKRVETYNDRKRVSLQTQDVCN